MSDSLHESLNQILPRVISDEFLSGRGIGNEIATRVEALLEQREQARAPKDFAASDRVRDELATLGVRIKDSPQGTTLERAV
jgi:cysteinyl-tRNA synthetase